MAFKIVPEAIEGEDITKDQIQALVDRHFQHTRKNKKDVPNNDYRKKMDRYEDTRACWFSMSEIEKLLSDNHYNPAEKEKWGIRIYFGYHHRGNKFPKKCNDNPNDPDCIQIYHQHTCILVVTHTRKDGGDDEIKNLDCLDDDKNSVSIAGANTGLDNGTLCPPQSCIGTKIN